jgi:DNA polymerase II small subunit/DNA polymerase delta subunit B
MPDHIEIPERPEHLENPLVVPVSVTISILAVLVAAVTLMGHRAHTEELLRQSQASDIWNQYQAKRIRLHAAEVERDQLSISTSTDTEKLSKLSKKYEDEIKHYQDDKENVSEKASDFEKERDLISHKADRFDGGEGLLEIALVICSITLLTNKKGFWYGGIFIGVVGVLLALTAFLLH